MVEVVKFIENIFCVVNLGFVNEFKMFFDEMDIDVYDVFDVVFIKFFGFMKFIFGLGWGGYCIFVDFYYFVW